MYIEIEGGRERKMTDRDIKRERVGMREREESTINGKGEIMAGEGKERDRERGGRGDGKVREGGRGERIS